MDGDELRGILAGFGTEGMMRISNFRTISPSSAFSLRCIDQEIVLPNREIRTPFESSAFQVDSSTLELWTDLFACSCTSVAMNFFRLTSHSKTYEIDLQYLGDLGNRYARSKTCDLENRRKLFERSIKLCRSGQILHSEANDLVKICSAFDKSLQLDLESDSNT